MKSGISKLFQVSILPNEYSLIAHILLDIILLEVINLVIFGCRKNIAIDC